MLRDFDRQQKFDKIVDMIKADIHKIWSEIRKPEGSVGTQPTDYFRFSYCKLPHMLYAREEFMQGIRELSGQFEEGPRSLFADLALEHLPSDAFALYVKDLWGKIRAEKELNLVFASRCSGSYSLQLGS
jgi:hypothetical protein